LAATASDASGAERPASIGHEEKKKWDIPKSGFPSRAPDEPGEKLEASSHVYVGAVL
jgi:hypothetical protein